MSARLHPVFCVACLSDSCLHLQRSHGTMLTPREVGILRAMADPRFTANKQMAHELGIAPGTIKVYISRIYQKLGWKNGCPRRLLLWIVANRERLGVELPTAEQFLAFTPSKGGGL